MFQPYKTKPLQELLKVGGQELLKVGGIERLQCQEQILNCKALQGDELVMTTRGERKPAVHYGLQATPTPIT